MQLIFKLLFFSFIVNTALGQESEQSSKSWSYYTGDMFLILCDKDPKTCSHYINGLIDGLETLDWWDKTCSYFSVPPPVTDFMLREIITRRLKQAPKDGNLGGHFSASGLIITILSEEFPCPKPISWEACKIFDSQKLRLDQMQYFRKRSDGGMGKSLIYYCLHWHTRMIDCWTLFCSQNASSLPCYKRNSKRHHCF